MFVIPQPTGNDPDGPLFPGIIGEVETKLRANMNKLVTFIELFCNKIEEEKN